MSSVIAERVPAQPFPISAKGLEAAFVAFGMVGTDAENQRLILKLMATIEAYLKNAN
jgi:hypothetical protein